MTAIPAAAHAASLETLYTFTGNGPDGYDPAGGLVRDHNGNLFGLTLGGGDSNAGVVYELSPRGGKQPTWRFKRIYSFQGGADGSEPNDHLVQDASGDLLGVTTTGGASNDGTIFLLTPSSTDPSGFTKSTLYSFSGSDGASPYKGLASDAAGNFYGTTASGGSNNTGTIFKLAPPANGGGWTLTKLHDFVSADGIGAPQGLTVASSGTLYGTTIDGRGAVYSFTPDGKGGGTLSVLYSFLGLNDGQSPYGGVVITASGDLVGTTFFYGQDTFGTVYQLRLRSNNTWDERTVAYFDGTTCGESDSGLLVTPSGKLFGTAGNPGCVFSLVPRASGKGYKLRNLTSSQSNTYPTGTLVANPQGDLFGVNQQGGNLAGQVFELRGAGLH